jgi:hypothetical protein
MFIIYTCICIYIHNIFIIYTYVYVYYIYIYMYIYIYAYIAEKAGGGEGGWGAPRVLVLSNCQALPLLNGRWVRVDRGVGEGEGAGEGEGGGAAGRRVQPGDVQVCDAGRAVANLLLIQYLMYY